MVRIIYLVRHGETEWSRDGRHTSITDLPLTRKGEVVADALRQQFSQLHVDRVMASPRARACDTARRATGRGDVQTMELLAEWNYGSYEGLTTDAIRDKLDRGWDLWSDGAPEGESPADVTARVARLFQELDKLEGTAACFAHGHVLRAVGALWTGATIEMGRHLLLDTGSVSTLVHSRDGRAIQSWNAGSRN